MDYSLPIAKRTRSREALMFKEYYEKKKRGKKSEEEFVDVGGSCNGDESDGEFDYYEVAEEGECSGSANVKKSETEIRNIDTVVSISSGEDDDDELVMKEGDKISKSGSLEETSSYSEEEEEEDVMEEEEEEEYVIEEEEEEEEEEDVMEEVDEEGKWRSVLVGGKKIAGLHILVDEELPFVAQRTRSSFGNKESVLHKSVVGDDDEEQEEEQDEDDDDDDGHIGEKSGGSRRNSWNAEKCDGNFEELACRKSVSGSVKQGKRKNYDVDKILVDLIWEKGEVEDLDSTEVKPIEEESETYLPLKFTFGIEESTPPEKSECEKEMDDLWLELELGLRSSEIDSTDDDMQVENKDGCPVENADVDTQCLKGNHQLVLDEEIGLKCKFCSYVNLEIKYILPTFDNNRCGRGDRIYYMQDEHSLLHGLNYFDSSDVHSSSGPCPLPEGTVWDIIPGMKRQMYPHQREGIEFIWKNIAGGIHIDKLKDPTVETGTGGCIISHAPGTGKTRLTLVFLKTYMKFYPTCRPVIIAPSNMLLTWEEEFLKWEVGISFHNLNSSRFSGKENMAAVSLLKHAKHQNQNVKSVRLVKLYSWKKDASILGISYTLFENLVDIENKKGGQSEAEQIKRILLELPTLLVLDEGHTPRNERSKLWKALSRTQTQKRIILSGTPFQNNFDELYNTLRLVRPKFASKINNSGNFPQKHGRRKNKERSKWASLINSIDQVRAMIDPFVHIHRGSILQENLLGLRDSVIVLHPLPLQKSLLTLLEDSKGKMDLLTWSHHVSLVSVHPSLFPQCILSDVTESPVDRDQLERLTLDHNAGVKTKFLMNLIWLSRAMNEKVLVFCQYLDPLTMIMKQLERQFDWNEGKEILQMDGQTGQKQRQSIINVFNNSTSEVKVLLASTTACCEGISLVGASRVVLLDVVWNPSVEMQAISRAYRLGQKKLVYVYHLLASGTMESEKYCRQVEKDRLSKLVFSSDRDGDTQKISSNVSEDRILEEMAQNDQLKNMFEKIIYQPKENNLIKSFGLVDSAQGSCSFYP